MVTKKYGIDFNSYGGALTLPVSAVSKGNPTRGTHELTHESGWTIRGEVNEECYTWVNKFEATHKTFGKVSGNFEDIVIADSEEAFLNFWENHKPEAWDYGDN
jgi:hypothetical protein